MASSHKDLDESAAAPLFARTAEWTTLASGIRQLKTSAAFSLLSMTIQGMVA
jgi:hypothetical protein